MNHTVSPQRIVTVSQAIEQVLPIETEPGACIGALMVMLLRFYGYAAPTPQDVTSGLGVLASWAQEQATERKLAEIRATVQ